MTVITILASDGVLQRAATEGGKDGVVEIWAGACNGQVTKRVMIRQGIGDLGDRLYWLSGNDIVDVWEREGMAYHNGMMYRDRRRWVRI